MKKHLRFVFEKLGTFQWRQHVVQTQEEGRPEQGRSEGRASGVSQSRCMLQRRKVINNKHNGADLSPLTHHS